MEEKAADKASVMAGELHALVGSLRRRLREQANAGDLTPSQVAALFRLDLEGPTTMTRLAEAEGVRPQSMSATVAALEAAGLVRGSPDPKDGRRTLLSVTESCHEALRAGRAARQDWLAHSIRDRLDEGEQETLAAALALLRRLAEEKRL